MIIEGCYAPNCDIGVCVCVCVFFAASSSSCRITQDATRRRQAAFAHVDLAHSWTAVLVCSWAQRLSTRMRVIIAMSRSPSGSTRIDGKTIGKLLVPRTQNREHRIHHKSSRKRVAFVYILLAPFTCQAVTIKKAPWRTCSYVAHVGVAEVTSKNILNCMQHREYH